MERHLEWTIRHEVEECLLCHDASCTQQCPKGVDPAGIIRSLRFDNMSGAIGRMPDIDVCRQCETKDCTSACVKNQINRTVDIPMVMSAVYGKKYKNIPGSGKYRKNIRNQGYSKYDLNIDFCGIHCENPFFLSSSIVASNYEMIAKAFEMGWAGAVFKTIGTFIPKEVSPRFSSTGKEGNSFTGFKNMEQISDHTMEENILCLKKLKKNYPKKIIIASILGQNEEEWTLLARKMTQAGVDIIECNFSCPHMSGDGLGSDVGQNPELVALYTKATRKGTPLPILAKMTPNLGNIEPPSIAAMQSGATGIAAINTIKSIMNIDLDDFVSGPRVDGKSAIGGYSGKTVKPIALRFIHDIKKHPLLENVPVSGMGGIENWKDAAEFIALGCSNIQITTAVMQYGYRIIDDLKEGLSNYLYENSYSSLENIVGEALGNVVPTENLNRHSIVYPKIDKTACIGCKRCYLSCYDGGHQAIKIDETTHKPKLIGKKCVGCHLCKIVCPAGAISSNKRIDLKSN